MRERKREVRTDDDGQTEEREMVLELCVRFAVTHREHTAKSTICRGEKIHGHKEESDTRESLKRKMGEIFRGATDKYRTCVWEQSVRHIGQRKAEERRKKIYVRMSMFFAFLCISRSFSLSLSLSLAIKLISSNLKPRNPSLGIIESASPDFSTFNR